MDHEMLAFTKIKQDYPSKRSPQVRVKDYREIEKPQTEKKFKEQSSRCSQCGIPMCSIGCPLSNQIPEWLSAAAEGRMKDAYLLSSATNTFPEICGRICPQDRLCEGSCVIDKGFGSVTIGSVEKHITDHAWQQGWVQGPKPTTERHEKVAIVGAGPAGLAAADILRALGYQVSVFDRQDRSGGLLMYGIPGFKLEKEVVLKRNDLLKSSGVLFRQDIEIGKDITFNQLRTDFNAVLICTGVYQPRNLNGPAFAENATTPALQYLKAHNRLNLGDYSDDNFPEKFNPKGKRILVIGGGDTAMDCIRTSLRAGAASVVCAYRRDRQNMPGSMKEVDHATQEGAVFKWLLSPISIKSTESSYKVGFVKNKLGFARSGRRPIEEIPGSLETLEADLIIESLGFDPENLKQLFPNSGLILNPDGTIETDSNTMQTSVPGVFAAGDIVRGASLVVWAIKDGRLAAENIHNFLHK